MPAERARSSAGASRRFDATAEIGRPVVDQGLEVRAVAGDEDADHAIRPITSSPGEGEATTAHQPIPRLNTRRSSSSSTWRASHANTRRALPGVPVELRPEAVRDDSRQVARDPAARHVRERLRPAAQRPRHVEVEARRSEQVGAVVVLVLEHLADEREAVRVHAGRREADHDVAARHGGAVDDVVLRDHPDTGAGEVELAVPVDARQLRGLAADERHAGRATDLGRALDELGDLVE